MSITIQSFTKNHIEDAAELVSLRFRTERSQNQLLPTQFERANAIVPHLQGLVRKVPGVIAMRENQIVGFLIGFRANLFRGQRGVFVADWAHAATEERIFDTYRAMYAEIAPHWLANGCFTHALQFYPHEKGVREAMFSSGFGMVVIDALRDLTPVQASAPQIIEIRQASLEMIETIRPLESALNRHLSSARIWLPLLECTGRNWESWFTDAQHALWLAYHNGEAVGYLCIESSSHNGLPVADDVTASITGAYTIPTMRGHRIGAALLNRALEWAQANGYQKCAVDFESANLPGSRFWLSHFQPVCYSVARRVDNRLAWAHAERAESSLW